MTTQPTDDDVAAIRELVGRSTLKAIEYHELTARWISSISDDVEEHDIDIQMNLQHRCDDEDFGYRLQSTISTDFGEATAVVAITYDYEGSMPERRTLLGFGNEVAVMTVFPYVREAISGITTKVFGQPVLLPVLPRGQIGFELDDSETASPGSLRSA